MTLASTLFRSLQHLFLSAITAGARELEGAKLSTDFALDLANRKMYYRNLLAKMDGENLVFFHQIPRDEISEISRGEHGVLNDFVLFGDSERIFQKYKNEKMPVSVRWRYDGGISGQELRFYITLDISNV